MNVAACACAALTLLAAAAMAVPAGADSDHSRPYADIGVNLTRAEVRERLRSADTGYFNTLHHDHLATFLLKTAAVMVAPFGSDPFTLVEYSLGYGRCVSGQTAAVMLAPFDSATFSLVESRLGFGKCVSGQIRVNGMCIAHG